MSIRRRLKRLRLAALRALGRLRYEHSILMLVALLIGIAAGYGAIGFRLLIDFWGEIAFGTTEERLIAGTVHLPWWHMLLAPVAGGVLVALILRHFMPQGRPQGVPEVIEAVALRDGRLDTRTGLANAVVNATALGFGSSIGREGPVVHLAAVISAFISARLHLSAAILRTLAGCAVASGVAASFNAPIAGVIFALEVVVGHYALHAFAPIVVAGVAGTVIARVHLGDSPAFSVPPLEIATFWEFPAFAVLGVVAALGAVLFMQAIFWANDCRRRFSPWPEWALPPLGGLAVGLVAIWLPEVIGVGYEGTDAALRGDYGLRLLLLLLAGKILLTALCIAARYGTGVFSPSIFIGAMLGGAFGYFSAELMPVAVSGIGLYAVVGMGAVTAAVLGAPMSTILIVFELTGDYEVTLAVMVATAIASMITHFAYGPSFFLLQLERRGLSLEAGKASHLLKSTGVKAVMRTEFATVEASEPIEKARRILLAQGGGKLPVIDEAGRLAGVITLAEMPDEIFDPDFDAPVRAADVARPNPVAAYADDSLETGLRLLERTGEHEIPVLSDDEERAVIGMLHREDVLSAYTRALLDSQGRL